MIVVLWQTKLVSVKCTQTHDVAREQKMPSDSHKVCCGYEPCPVRVSITSLEIFERCGLWQQPRRLILFSAVKDLRLVGRNNPVKRALFHCGRIPDCEPGSAGCFFPGGFVAPYKILAGKAVQRYVNRQRESNPLGQAHSPAIDLRLKTAPLAGLFRPTGLLLHLPLIMNHVTLQETPSAPRSPASV